MSKNNGIRIIHSNVIEEVERLTREGWEPVECSIGGRSIVGRLKMDHHGELSNLEGVAVRAYCDHFGACKTATQGFVVTGQADADATFAIAALAGLLPHPSRAEEFAKSPEWVRHAMTQDLTDLATLVNLMDTDPIGNRTKLPVSDNGSLLIAWQALDTKIEDRTAFHAGIDRWRLFTGPSAPMAMIKAAANEEASRIWQARDIGRNEHMGMVTVLESKVWGFDVWYADLTPVIVALTPAGKITVGCVNTEQAEKFFGRGGLKNIFPELQPEGWGGREAIGGSPPGMKMSWEQALEAGKLIASKARV